MISVCIASHNGERFIKEQIDSIICQLGPNDEIIVSDDGSTDCTLDILASYQDKRIKVHKFVQTSRSRHPHSFVCKNFENALHYAVGDYIFLADQDDLWMPNKVKKCLFTLKDYTLVVHQADICDGMLNRKGLLMYKDQFVFKNYLALRRGKYYGCTIAFRRELLDKILPFPKDLILHDQWIGCMAELTGNVYYEHESLIMYRQHNNNTSGGKSTNSTLFKLLYRLRMYYHLKTRTFKFRKEIKKVISTGY